MQVDKLIKTIGADFFTGVPDSQLKPLCSYLLNKYGIDANHHIIAANEGNCVALAAGYHLATGRIPVVYLQNSGEGNIINPVASLLNEKVYAIPTIFIVGWRGEPGIHDEPQHIYQGEITLKLLEDMDIAAFVIDKDTTDVEISDIMEKYNVLLSKGKSVAFVVRKNALSYDEKTIYRNNNTLIREEIITHIVNCSMTDPIISTTGKTSRELFEVREQSGQEHKYDFLTVGSMGHTSSIALGVAINTPNQKVWCIDGDGSAIMHMGAMAVIGSTAPKNLVHIVINNEAHESVGGMPTVATKIDLCKIAEACGYVNVLFADNMDDLDKVLNMAKHSDVLTFIEIKSAIGSRENLGRPTQSTLENKNNFMQYLRTVK